MHPPQRGGNAPNAFPLRISLSLAECPDNVEGHDVTLALKQDEVTLEPTYHACRPAPGSRVGEEGNEDANVDFKGGNWRIKRPHLPNGHLDGEPLGDKPLCTIITDGTTDDSLTLTLRSRHRALIVVPDEPGRGPQPLKDKVLQLLLQKSLKDRTGFITWGRASLKRKSGDAPER